MTGPPEGGGGRGPTPRPSAQLRNLSGHHTTPSRLSAEAVPRMEAVVTLLAAAVLGLVDFAVIGAPLTALADAALSEASLAGQEIEAAA